MLLLELRAEQPAALVSPNERVRLPAVVLVVVAALGAEVGVEVVEVGD